MRIEDFTPETLRRMLRILRTRAGFTQRELAQRTADLPEPFKPVRESQISLYERGARSPSFLSFLSLLAGCSRQGRLEFGLLESALAGMDARREAKPMYSDVKSAALDPRRIRSKLNQELIESRLKLTDLMQFITDIGASIPVELGSKTAKGVPANAPSPCDLIPGHHPSVQVLMAFNARELRGSEHRQVCEHVKSCRGCQEMLANLPYG